MFKKYLSLLFQLSDKRLFFTRYVANLVGLAEIILLPILFAPDIYAQVELFRQLFLFSPLMILGAHSGYLICFYKEKRDLQSSLLIMTVLVGTVVASGVSIMVPGLFPALAVFLIIVVTSFEKILVTKGRLVIASIYKAIISLILIVVAIYFYYLKPNISALVLYSGCLIVGILLWSCFVWFTTDFKRSLSSIRLRRIFLDFACLVRHGFLVSIQSYILVGYFIFDRLIVRSYYPQYSSEYALGFSLSQIILVGINTLSFAAQQKVGENLDEFTLKDYNNLLVLVAVVFAFLLLVSVPMVYLLSLFVSSYGNFVYSFLLIAVFFGSYYALSAIAIIGFYKGMAKSSLYVLLSFSLLNLLVTIAIAANGYGYYLNLFKSGFFLLLSAVVFDRMIRTELTIKALV